jgi:hypothetical protein
MGPVGYGEGQQGVTKGRMRMMNDRNDDEGDHMATNLQANSRTQGWNVDTRTRLR